MRGQTPIDRDHDDVSTNVAPRAGSYFRFPSALPTAEVVAKKTNARCTCTGGRRELIKATGAYRRAAQRRGTILIARSEAPASQSNTAVATTAPGYEGSPQHQSPAGAAEEDIVPLCDPELWRG